MRLLRWRRGIKRRAAVPGRPVGAAERRRGRLPSQVGDQLLQRHDADVSLPDRRGDPLHRLVGRLACCIPTSPSAAAAARRPSRTPDPAQARDSRPARPTAHRRTRARRSTTTATTTRAAITRRTSTYESCHELGAASRSATPEFDLTAGEGRRCDACTRRGNAPVVLMHGLRVVAERSMCVRLVHRGAARRTRENTIAPENPWTGPGAGLAARPHGQAAGGVVRAPGRHRQAPPAARAAVTGRPPDSARIHGRVPERAKPVDQESRRGGVSRTLVLR